MRWVVRSPGGDDGPSMWVHEVVWGELGIDVGVNGFWATSPWRAHRFPTLAEALRFALLYDEHGLLEGYVCVEPEASLMAYVLETVP